MLLSDAGALSDWMENSICTAFCLDGLTFYTKRRSIISNTATEVEVIRESCWAVIVTNVVLVVVSSAKDAVLPQCFSSCNNCVCLSLRDAGTLANRIYSEVSFALFSQGRALVLSSTLAKALIVSKTPWL